MIAIFSSRSINVIRIREVEYKYDVNTVFVQPQSHRSLGGSDTVI